MRGHRSLAIEGRRAVAWQDLDKFRQDLGKISARFRLFKDANDVAVEPSMAGTTREDQEIKHRNVLKSKLRAHPLMPCDPQDTTQPFLDMDSGVRLRQVVFGKFSTRMPKNMRKSRKNRPQTLQNRALGPPKSSPEPSKTLFF